MPNLPASSANPHRLDPDSAQQTFERVQTLLKRQQLVEQLVHRQHQQTGDQRADLVENLVARQHDAELRGLLDSLHPADVANLLESLPPAERLSVWTQVRGARDGEILLELSDAVRESLIRTMDRESLIAATGSLDADEIADLAPDLPPEVVEEVQQSLSLEEREQLRTAMSYPDDTVGAIMDFELLTVRDDQPLEAVFIALRQLDSLPDHSDQVFVIDADNTLKGTLAIHRLLTNHPHTPVTQVMATDMLRLTPFDSTTEAAQAFERYDLVSAPVVSRAGKLIGRLTVNEVVDVIREASDEQTLSKAGLQEEDLFAPLIASLRNRAPWLLINLGTASIAAFIASRFEDTVRHIVMLAFLMSIVAGIGGNSGNQTMTLVIRALALGRIKTANWWSLARRELALALLIGVCGGTIAGAFAWAISGNSALGGVMMAAMALNLLVGTLIGMLVPLVRSRFRKDPAIGSSVLLTFATDTMGFLIFLGLAQTLLR